ncbi:NAD(P)-binding protein [Byssothecium circinans]|uniref:NAD(P)-binding protein n=1 Tax=Byssothecium circinans TaxID=147558 RepID=A0A6A5UCT4_9PLEO|nr:NAD(P)-binding protein [Byssothecium circinans]
MEGIPSLTGVALITGAGSGIGKEEAANLAAEESRSVATNKEYRPFAILVDVSDAASVQEMVNKTVGEFGRIDYSVNAAGIGNSTLRPTGQSSLEELNRIIDVNLKGTAFCVRAVIEVMRKQEPVMYTSKRERAKDNPPRSLGRGAIVNLGSAYSYMTSFGTFAYTASKHGVIGLTKAAGFDYAKDGIRVNAVCPGPVDTPIMQRSIARAPVIAQTMKGIPLGGQMAIVDEVASVVLFLCGPGASYMTGSGLLVDAGVTLSSARL